MRLVAGVTPVLDGIAALPVSSPGYNDQRRCHSTPPWMTDEKWPTNQ
jgi:hypothetical protein